MNASGITILSLRLLLTLPFCLADLIHIKVTVTQVEAFHSSLDIVQSIKDAVVGIGSEVFQCWLVEIEIAEVSMRDVRALSALSSRVKKSSQARSGTEPEVTLGGKGRFGCIAPDPDSWFSPASDTPKAAEQETGAICLPSLTVVLPIDFATRNHSVQELLTLADASLAEAERELGETRAHLCHTEDGSCQLF